MVEPVLKSADFNSTDWNLRIQKDIEDMIGIHSLIQKVIETYRKNKNIKTYFLITPSADKNH